MIYDGYARVSTDGQSVDAQVKQLRAATVKHIFKETANGAKSDRVQGHRVLDRLDAGDVLMVTRLDRLARSTRDLLNILAAIAEKKAEFRSRQAIKRVEAEKEARGEIACSYNVSRGRFRDSPNYDPLAPRDSISSRGALGVCGSCHPGATEREPTKRELDVTAVPLSVASQVVRFW